MAPIETRTTPDSKTSYRVKIRIRGPLAVSHVGAQGDGKNETTHAPLARPDSSIALHAKSGR